jgi:hypothetical protein
LNFSHKNVCSFSTLSLVPTGVFTVYGYIGEEVLVHPPCAIWNRSVYTRSRILCWYDPCISDYSSSWCFSDDFSSQIYNFS